MTPYGPAWEEELELLLEALPPRVASAASELALTRGELLEIVLDLGREPEARCTGAEVVLDHQLVTHDDLAYVVDRVGLFGDDNRAGIERTLHRISAIRNRAGIVVGLTCRVGRAVTGTIDLIKDIVVTGQSILLLGPPGVGKTTMLRECARVLSEECGKRVVVVDTSNEIGGDGDIPHPGIGRARRMQVNTPAMQHAVMIEAVENHMPQVIVIDEIGTELEAAAARTIAERGVQLVATAHGTSLDNLMVNPTLNDLLGGIQTVTLSDEEARRRGTQKSVLERKAPPTFDVLVEIQERTKVVVHLPLDETVDEALRGKVKPAQLRIRTDSGEIVTRLDDSREREPNVPLQLPVNRMAREGQGEPRSRRRDRAADPQLPGFAARTGLVSIFPYGVSRQYVEQSMKELHLAGRIQQRVDDADVVLTLKNYYRRQDSPVRAAESTGIPVQVLRSNTVAQIKGALTRMYGAKGAGAEEAALAEVREAITRVREQDEPVDLAPQNAYIRRLQHKVVEGTGLSARSAGSEPNRHLVILRPDE